MHATLTLFGHTLTINVGIDCPNHGDPERDSALDALVETTGPHPDERAELDARVRPARVRPELGFRPTRR